ncbi:hypothetical protein PAHAL_1G013700 [Panicum hallii]|uniref:Uncharacterized protein n=1 Tax=Panicum hallii TaxID=206008 RepID=A0A2S3GKM2_9POAL|nr:hypothetical protein PAHAL_1G013700 [Panicum hallii]
MLTLLSGEFCRCSVNCYPDCREGHPGPGWFCTRCPSPRSVPAAASLPSAARRPAESRRRVSGTTVLPQLQLELMMTAQTGAITIHYKIQRILFLRAEWQIQRN